MLKMKCHVTIEITHSKRGVIQGFTTHSALETLRLRLRITNIAIRCKTLHNPTLVMCYFYNNGLKIEGSLNSGYWVPLPKIFFDKVP